MAMKIKGKKGMFFTLFSIILLGVMIYSFTTRSAWHYREQTYSIETRVMTMNNFLKDIEQDLDRALYIASYRSILGLNQVLADQNGTYIFDYDSVFNELAVNGTVNQTMIPIMEFSSLSNWTGKISHKAQERNMMASLHEPQITLYQTDPWTLKINFSVLVRLKDIKGLARWNTTLTSHVEISIENFEDPLYAAASFGRYANKIDRTPFTVFVDSNNNTENLSIHVNNSYYIASNASPSYLMRFEGNFSASECGIESLVNVADLISIGLYRNKSVVDHIYWSNQNPTNYKINYMEDWFRLDNENGHLETYGVEDIYIP